MLQNIKRRKSGFTLIELAIVLAVAGLMFVGLWRLLSSGNQQVRDQSAASQQTQLISAVKGFLLSAQGQTFMATPGPNANFALPMPAANTSNAVCQADAGLIAAGATLFCNFLPTGLTSTSPNAYGQIFNIRVLKDASAAGTPPNTYSFMILTSTGDTIPDTSGGRIAAFIGGDGGFIYSNAVCGAPVAQMACGSYGTWSANAVTVYGFLAASAASGHIASRTYVSPTADNTFPWLARPLMPGDNANIPVWNSMQTDLFLGTQGGIAANPPNNLWLGANKTLTTGGGIINMQGGTMTGSATSNITLTGSALTTNPLIALNGTNAQSVFLLNAVNGCVIANPQAPPAGCNFSINTDNIQVSGLVYANGFYAQTFIYTSSDMRLKKNIRPLADALDDVMKLKPVSFAYKSNGEESLGVIAQDLEKVYPQLVTKGDGLKMVNYQGLISPLIGAVQQLKQENDDLREQLREQKIREDKLEQEIGQRGKAN